MDLPKGFSVDDHILEDDLAPEGNPTSECDGVGEDD